MQLSFLQEKISSFTAKKIFVVIMTFSFDRASAITFSEAYSTCTQGTDAGRFITVQVASPPSVMDPLFVSGIHQLAIAKSMHKRLIRLDASGDLVGEAASFWRVRNNFKEFDVCLKDRYFSDGTELTERDLEYSLRRISTSKIYADVKSTLDLENLEVIKLPEETFNKSHCFTIRIKKPSRNFIRTLAAPIAVIVKQPADQKGTLTEPIGLGDFLMTNDPKRSGAFALYRFRNDFNRSLPKCIFIVRKKSKSDSGSKIEGNLIPDIDLSIIDQRKFFETPRSDKVWFHNGLYTLHLYFNLRQKLVRNKDFRLDLGQLMRQVDLQHGTLLPSLKRTNRFLPNGIGHPSYYVPKTPRSITEEAFRRRWGAMLEGKSITVLGCFNELSPAVVAELDRIFQTVGARFVYIFDEFGPYLERYKKGDVDAIFVASSMVTESPDAYVSYPFQRLSNYDRWFHEEFEMFRADILDAATIADDEKRQLRYAEVFSQVEDSGLVIPFYRYSLPISFSDRVRIPDYEFSYHIDLTYTQFKEVGL